MSLSAVRQADVVGAFGAASGYFGGILNIYSVYFDSVVGQVYPSGLRLNWASTSYAESAFLDLRLLVSGDVVSTKICGGRDDFGYGVVNFPFLDGDVPRSASCGVYVSRLVRFAGAPGCVPGFGARSGLLTQKFLNQGYRYHWLRETFSKFYRRWCDLISGFQVGLKSLLRRGFWNLISMVALCMDWRGLLALMVFQRSLLEWFPIVGRLAIALVYCNRLHAWWSLQSQLATLLSSSIAP